MKADDQLDQIRVHGLVLQCIVGIHAHERVNEQPLCINLTLGLDTRDAARTGKISRTVHYGDVAEQVSLLLRFRRYRLLEAAAEEIAWMLLCVHPRLEWAKVRVEKPQALAGLAAAASLSITRSRRDLADAERSSPPNHGVGGVVQHRVVMREAELSVLALEPHQRWEQPQQSRRLTWVLGGSVCVGERMFVAGQHWCDEGNAALPTPNAGDEPTRVFFCYTNKDIG